jgi:16S rRNA (uracil1498-N3)-methyltransferase
MNLPFFYIESINAANELLLLDEDTSRHVVSVLRMKPGEKLHLTNGKGNLYTAAVEDDHKKKCTVRTIDVRTIAPSPRKISIGISVLKNTSRFEWFLEKVTEIGVNSIIPLLCERTEKEKFRHDRLQQILISAMLQSQQCWLPVLHEPIGYELLFRQEEVIGHAQKMIAHCIDGEKRNLSALVNDAGSSQIILIGPEGDFTKEEIDFALRQHFVPVSLGENRLRAETAGMVAAALLAQYRDQ